MDGLNVITPEKQKPWILRGLSPCFCEVGDISVFIRAPMGNNYRH